ncbi:hypothetical protein ABH940_000841 [Streptacidiphilus sp. BW17]|uniref:hypothetical protein n=1 Tax=Streptacidiphilus sp. BW17 TaxID=3156274 RepID=UPI0035167100
MTDTVEIAVELELPPDFRPLTIGTSLDEARAAVTGEIGERANEVSAAAVDALAEDYAAASQWAVKAGVFYAATCLGLLDGELTFATFTMARAELDCKDLDATVDGIVKILGAAGPEGRAAKRYELPCGPAAVAVGAAVQMVVPADEARNDEDIPVQVASLEAWIPVPATVDPMQQSAVVLRFNTPSMQHWEAYCPVLVQALQTVRFPDDEGGGSAAAPFTPLATAPDADPFAGASSDTDTGSGPAPAASANRITSALG